VCTKGKILELSKVYHEGTQNGRIFAFIEICGIRLVGSVIGFRVSKDNTVILDRCGLGKDRQPFYDFIVAEGKDLPIQKRKKSKY
jgi:hypothetical protein